MGGSGVNLCGEYRVISSHGSVDSPTPPPSPPPRPGSLSAAECSNDEMIENYKTAALKGMGVATIMFALIMILWAGIKNRNASL